MTSAIPGQATSPVATSATATEPRLSPRSRKLVLTAHIAASGAWLGMEVALGVLVVSGLVANDRDAAVLSLGIAAIASWPLVVAGVVAFGTGVVLGFGSRFGLVRTRWVLVKLALTVVLLALVALLLLPGAAELGASADAALDGGSRVALTAQALFPPIVSSSALVFAMALGVTKPWGKRKRAVASPA